MEFFGQVLAWFADPATWSGRNGIPIRLWEHVSLSAASLAVGTLIALPVGLVIGHTGRGAVLAVSIANIGRAIPSLGLLGIVFPLGLVLGLGLGFWPSLIALVALAIPPIIVAIKHFNFERRRWADSAFNTYSSGDGDDDE